MLGSQTFVSLNSRLESNKGEEEVTEAALVSAVFLSSALFLSADFLSCLAFRNQGFSGDTSPCKVTPVILHGVVSLEFRVDRLRGWVPREQKMVKGHLLRE